MITNRLFSCAAHGRCLVVAGLLLAGAALSGCTATSRHATSVAPPPPIAQGDQVEPPTPPTPGIKPLTVEQEEQVGGIQ